MSQRISRRRFLGLSAAGMGALLVSRVPGAFAATEAQTRIRPQVFRSPQMPLAVQQAQTPLPGSMIPHAHIRFHGDSSVRRFALG